MAADHRRILAALLFAVSILAFLTLFGAVTWGDAVSCALRGQYAFGPVCAHGAVLAIGGAFIGLFGFVAWPSRPDEGDDTAVDQEHAATDHRDVEQHAE